MKITELMNPQGIFLHASPATKAEAIEQLASLQKKCGNITDEARFIEGIKKREESGSTAVGQGIAIPHAKNSSVAQAGVVAMTVPAGVDYESLDGAPTNLLFMIAAPENGSDTHLEVLARLMTLLMDADLRQKLLDAASPEAFLSLIDEKEAEKDAQKAPEHTAAPAKETAPQTYRILAVTACPTGIAHTYMAAEALEAMGKEMNIPVKAETNGSGGAKNILTEKEIREADGIIIAADKNVEMARFDGKKLIKTKVSDGIHKPKELIESVLSPDCPVYHHEGGSAREERHSAESAGHQLYKHLMNGVSHMLPFVIGGGILIALSFLLDNYEIDPANFGANTPVAAFFKNIGGYAFSFMLPVLAGYIAMSIADRPGLAVGFVGGYLASIGATFAAPGGDIPAGFLGALLAGFAAGYLTLFLEKLCNYLPNSLEGIKPVLLYPLIGTLMIAIVMCAVNPFVAMLNSALTNGLNAMGSGSRILLGAILAGMMAIDMGGPFNKAAYVFGSASIASGNFDMMAAVMIGGMVPPIAIALATSFFKHKFTENERKSGPVNYIMGLCFITEGAIPFAASDPLKVIPSCVAGSAVAGAVSMAFHCTLRAPHGGIFVFPVVGNVGGYLIALIAGALVGMILLALLKKNVENKYTTR